MLENGAHMVPPGCALLCSCLPLPVFISGPVSPDWSDADSNVSFPYNYYVSASLNFYFIKLFASLPWQTEGDSFYHYFELRLSVLQRVMFATECLLHLEVSFFIRTVFALFL